MHYVARNLILVTLFILLRPPWLRTKRGPAICNGNLTARRFAFASVFVMLITRLCCLSQKEARLMLRKTFDQVLTTKTVTNFTAVYAT